MVTKEQCYSIKAYYDIGLSLTAIANRFDLHPVTVSKIIKGGFTQMQKGSKLNDFKDYIVERLKLYPELTGVSILKEITDMGYTGGISILRDYLRSIRPEESSEIKMFETEPGEQFQVDWGQGITKINHEGKDYVIKDDFLPLTHKILKTLSIKPFKGTSLLEEIL